MTCPTNPEHGRVFDLPSGNWYCSHQEHDRTHSRSIFSEDEVMEGHVRVHAPAPKAKRVRRGR